MKKITFALVLAVVLLGSCAMQSGEPGTVRMGFNLAASARAGGESLTYVRVWVYSDNVLVKASVDADFHGAPLVSGAGTVTISDLPPGNAYRLVAAAGDDNGSSSRFRTLRYGMSPVFAVNGGAETGVAMTLTDIATDYNEVPGGLKGVVVANDDTIYAASAGNLYSGTSLEPDTATVWSAGTINSLSLGYDSLSVGDFPLVNTTNGVYDATVPAVPVLIGGPLAAPGALQSGSFDDVYFFQGEGQFGGLAGEDLTWTTIDLDIQGLTGKPVMDFFVIENAGVVSGFFATKIIGAFRMGQDFLDSDPDFADINKDNPNLTFFGEKLPLIQAFGYTGDASGTLYLGTKNGAYRTATSGLGTVKLVDGTKGINITKLAVGGGAVAMLSAKELILLKNSRVFRMPYVVGLVGDLTDLAWRGTKVIVTGSAGIGEIETSGIGN